MELAKLAYELVLARLRVFVHGSVCFSSLYASYACIGRLQQPQIILLKEGTDTSQGKMQLISNINACTAVVDTVRPV
jgi:hypothetical protein